MKIAVIQSQRSLVYGYDPGNPGDVDLSKLCAAGQPHLIVTTETCGPLIQ